MGRYNLVRHNELYHHGKKGQKWGVRRYQNEDGTLTELGKKRYARDAHERGYDKQGEDGTYYKTAGKKGGRKETLGVDASRYVTEDMQRTQRVLQEGSNLAGKTRELASKAPDKKRTRMDLSKMSDKELRDQINRELLERQYNDVFNPQRESKGKAYAMKTLEVGGAVLATAGAAVGLALQLKQLLGK